MQDHTIPSAFVACAACAGDAVPGPDHSWPLPLPLVTRMLSHALRTAPAECVGVLSGPVTAGPPPSLRDCHPLTNLAPRQDRFLADPVEQITLGKQLRAQGARILAIYHSHPHGSGIPSRTDLQEHNHPGLLQLIIAMGIPGRLELRGYRYTPDRQAIPQRLVIVPAVPSG